MAKLTAVRRKNLPGKVFAGPGRSFPMNDKVHAQKAVQMEKYADPATKARINSRARGMGIAVGGKLADLANGG